MTAAVEGRFTDWRQAWQPMIDAVGRDFGPPDVVWGADSVERGSIRRYLEPLEFDCPLHHDDEIACRHGHGTIVPPVTSLMMFAAPAIWSPGDPPVFDQPERDAQPRGTTGRPADTGLEPPYSGYFATDLELEFAAPVRLGDRLGRRGRRLTGCTPKETSVGRGAFVSWETDIVNQDELTVAVSRYTLFLYTPRGEPR